MKIGIGIISYRRPKTAYICARSLINCLEQGYKYKIICCVDDENVSDYKDMKNLNVQVIYHPNYGISINKSIAMYYLKDCDHIFLLEEDIEFLKPGLIDLYLKVHNYKNVGFIDTIPKFIIENKNKIVYTEKLPFTTLIYCNVNTAQIMSITKETFNKVGYLNPAFKGYGFEHCEYTYRCKVAKLYPEKYFFTMSNVYDYYEFQNCNNSLTPEEVKKSVETNEPIFGRETSKIRNINDVYIGEDKLYQYITNSKIME